MSAVILAIDVNCFYAQAEEIHNPELAQQPIGVLQRSFVVRLPQRVAALLPVSRTRSRQATTNYVARRLGAPKCGSKRDVLARCPVRRCSRRGRCRQRSLWGGSRSSSSRKT